MSENLTRGISSVGRASGWQPEGQGFESPILHSNLPTYREFTYFSEKIINPRALLAVEYFMNQQEHLSEIAWQNGKFLPRNELSISPGDAGFVLGATVTEQLRTFRGKIFLSDDHAQRLANSLHDVGIVPNETMQSIFSAANQVATHNHKLLMQGNKQSDQDLGVVIFITPGLLPAQNNGLAGKPSATVHSFPLAYSLWADSYETGTNLQCVSIQQVSEKCWPISAKVRSRLHYFLAEQEATTCEKGSRPLLSHADGRISETSTANIAALHGRTIVTPTEQDALMGVSMNYLKSLAEDAGFLWESRSFNKDELITADEVFLTSTPWCILAAVQIDGQPVGKGVPGPVYREFLNAWSKNVGIDIADQAHFGKMSQTYS